MNTIIFIMVFLVGTGAISFAPRVPTKKKDLERVIKLANPNKNDIFYDLGCGDGRLVFCFAEKGIKSFGFEISPFFYLFCQIKKFLTGNKNAHFKFKSFYSTNINEASIIFMFGTDNTINTKKLEEKIKKGLKPGTKIISYVSSIEWLKPIKIDKPNKNELSIYLYEI
ncbi:MAG: hypothetical protein PHF46_01165 [Candidatus Gracilibacteria bacterium]|nr:hypothetical protein [Candidatus Gracilibacteria bacterium]MDD4529976.1 hypothetical protein [Candidatus Gracilibacteria bacterium]